MQDIIQPERRSVRNIAMDRPQTVSPEAENPAPKAPVNETPFPPMPPRNSFGNKRPLSKKWIIAGSIVGALLILFVVGLAFAGATVTITPRHAVINMDSRITAYLSPAEGEVGFEVVEMSENSTRSVTATGQEKIERPASGSIVIYNNYDASSQKLIKNTRFATPDGKIYRIQESVTVPGQHKDATGAMVPGSAEAKVFADAVGEEYNIDLSDFTIPGFKEANDPRYDKFYARSKTPMTGGFSGTVKTASAADTKKGEDEMKAELNQKLVDEARSSLPAEFILLPDSALVSFESLPNTAGGDDGSVVLNMKGTIHVLAINKDDIAMQAATERISGYAGEGVTLESADNLSISLLNASTTDIISASSTQVQVSGPATLVWTFDTEALQKELAGKARSATKNVFGKYSGIEKADVVVRPFWKFSLPKDAADIKITIAKITE